MGYEPPFKYPPWKSISASSNRCVTIGAMKSQEWPRPQPLLKIAAGLMQEKKYVEALKVLEGAAQACPRGALTMIPSPKICVRFDATFCCVFDN